LGLGVAGAFGKLADVAKGVVAVFALYGIWIVCYVGRDAVRTPTGLVVYL